MLTKIAYMLAPMMGLMMVAMLLSLVTTAIESIHL